MFKLVPNAPTPMPGSSAKPGPPPPPAPTKGGRPPSPRGGGTHSTPRGDPAGAPKEAGPRESRPTGPARPLRSRVRAAFHDIRAALSEFFAVFENGRAARQIHEFADAVNAARTPEAIEAALLRAVGTTTRAPRVELMLDRDQQDNPSPRLIGLWPDGAAAMTESQVEALGYPLCLGLWCGDHYQMTLQVYPHPGSSKGGRWSPRVVRRLRTLCAMAGAAERGIHASQRGRIEAPVDLDIAVRDATFLNAVLPYALTQAQRHREPLAVLCLELDDTAVLIRGHGDEALTPVIGRIADAAARTLRGSDVVAQLDDNRIMVVLPNTGGTDALTVAGVIRSAVQAVCQAPGGGLPTLSVSIGVASYPADGRRMLDLLQAADEAMHRARSRGHNQVATTSCVPPKCPTDRETSPTRPRPDHQDPAGRP